ncbi:hypothetical protein [Halosimplex halobium]|uniref:hypothetical protein n=1 Tax=Halosimplex halobium TaxID=3396618 RepID=UPI003F543DBB
MNDSCVHCGDGALCYVEDVPFCEECFTELEEMMEYLPIDEEEEEADSQTTLDGFSDEPSSGDNG